MPYDDSIPDSTLLTIHPELKPILDQHGSPKLPIPTRASISRLRKGFTAANLKFNKSALARNALGCTDPESASQRYWSETDHDVPARDHTTIPIRIYKPNSTPASGVPIVIMFHGGGWVTGGLDTEATLCRLFTTKLGVVVINVAFRNYPDVPFGVPTLDCYDVVKWAATNARSYAGNPELGFVLAGVSGGASYASICAHLARNEGLTPPVTGQWLACPVIGTLARGPTPGSWRQLYDTKTVNRSVEQNQDAPLMNQAFSEALQGFAEFDWDSPLFSPLHFGGHANLGSGGVYVQVAGLDPWRDAGRIYLGLCAREGNRTKLRVYSGLPHCWWAPFHMLKVSAEWLDDSVQGLLWLLTAGGGEGGVGRSRL